MVSPGGSCSTLAMRGPRDVKAEVSAGTGAGFGFMAGADGGVVLAGTTGALFVEAAALARRGGCRLAGDLCARFSFKIRRQKRMSPDGDALMPFCESRSLMAR